MSKPGAATPFAQDLLQAICSGTPIVYVDTTEDERVEQAVQEVRDAIAPRILTWTATAGLEERFDQGAAGKPEAAPTAEALLQLLLGIDSKAPGDRTMVVLAHDLVGLQTLGALELRLLKDLFRAWEPTRKRPNRRTLLMTGANWTLPAALSGYVETRALPLPRGAEIAAEFEDRRGRLDALGLTPELLGDRAAGLPKLAVEQVFRRMESAASGGPAGRSAGILQQASLSLLEAVKREAIRRTHMLEILPVDRPVELGGFAAFKDWFALRRDFLKKPGRETLRPRGVLFLGFPGCGKSHAARWIAQELRLPLVAMDFGRVQDRWVGSSEARLLGALQTIEAAAPLVLFLDEIEKAVAGAGTESSGVTTRLVGQFLTWLSDHRTPVFVVATCNSASMPQELGRTGRFDANFLVLLPGAKEREQVCQAVVAEIGLTLEEGVMEQIVAATDGYAGSELRQVVIEAAYRSGFNPAPIGMQQALAATGAVTPLSRRARGRELLDEYERHRGDGGFLEAGDRR